MIAEDRISSIVSVSVARELPSESIGIKLLKSHPTITTSTEGHSHSTDLVTRHCLAGYSLLHAQERLSVVKIGTATVRTGTDGLQNTASHESHSPLADRHHLYFATSRAVDPPRVTQIINVARTLCAVRTAEEARDSKGDIGNGT